MGRSGLAFASAAVLAGLAPFAWCEPVARAEGANPRVELALTRGEGTGGCLDSSALEKAVERRLEHPVFTSSTPVDLRLELAFEETPRRGFSAAIVLRDRTGAEIGRRELTTASRQCSVLDDSLALVIALLVDSPEARERATAAPPTASTSPSLPANAPPVPPPAPAPIRVTIPPDVLPAREPYRVDVAATVAALVGPLPGLAWGPELTLAVRPPHFVELRLRPAFFPTRQVEGPSAGRGGRLSLVQVGLDVCPIEQELETLRFSGCVGQSIGWVNAEGFGFVRNGDPSSWVYSLGLAAGALWFPARPLFLSLGLTAAVPLERDSYVSLGPNGTSLEVFRPAPLSGELTAGLGLEL
ncbi:MAG TPA: hypothetical protein VGQ57_05805 [Polyangiaceae bacterium]|jgi:hypothetical protein|nr:hypothetical protein [Polyangiaceae bacterium]